MPERSAGLPRRPAESAVDDLFARMRAERAAAVARARDVLAADPAPDPPPPGEPPPPEAAPAEPDPSAADEACREARDAAVEAVQAQLVRRLKRALQDEQNEALDRLRAGRGRPSLAGLVPAGDQERRLAAAAESLLAEAAAAGAGSVGGAGGGPPHLADVVRELVADLAGPLRRSLDEGLRASADDDMAAVDRIGAAYRACRAERVDEAASDAVVAAFAAGVMTVADQPLRWVVDDGGEPCADCEDNALAGALAPREPFPTGQRRPPAHRGCRCLLVPAAVRVEAPAT